MRWLALAFGILIVALQYPMWLGKGGWLKVRESDRQLTVQRETNAKLKARNDALDADVRDLKTGSEAIEERARAELGMIRQDEVFFQVQTGGAGVKPSPPPATRNAAAPAHPAAPH
jgi:cell division protein FtsB